MGHGSHVTTLPSLLSGFHQTSHVLQSKLLAKTSIEARETGNMRTQVQEQKEQKTCENKYEGDLIWKKTSTNKYDSQRNSKYLGKKD